MSIHDVMAWVGNQSAWWLLVLPLGFWVVLQPLRRRLFVLLWRRGTEKDIQRLERDRDACLKMGQTEGAAWCEWRRTTLKELLEDASPTGVGLKEDIEAYARRWHALVDASWLVKDQSTIETAKAALVEDPAFDELRRERIRSLNDDGERNRPSASP